MAILGRRRSTGSWPVDVLSPAGDVLGSGSRRATVASAEHLLDRVVRNVEHGRFERSLSGLTAVSALVTGVEVYLEHYKASFGNKWMWSPIVLTPPLW
jgi:hypothetical protein